jgi:hypothetical protein
MTPIDHDAVIDAIARLFPDGIDCTEHGSGDAAEWHTKIAYDLGIYDDDGDYFDALDEAFAALHKAGRLRALPYSDDGWYVLSYAEQARRIVDAMDPDVMMHPKWREERIDLIANVLAGKTEKRS